jgi:hypothetical protein
MLKDYEIKAKYCEMLKLFMDNCPPGPIVSYCPFGIHSICAEGRLLSINPGQWYGPQMISIVLRNVVQKLDPVFNFKLHVCLDSNIFLDELEELVKKSFSIFILIPIRLGIDNI